MERYTSKFSFLSLLLITFFGCDYIDDLLTIQDLYNPDDEIRANVGDFGESWETENK